MTIENTEVATQTQTAITQTPAPATQVATEQPAGQTVAKPAPTSQPTAKTISLSSTELNDRIRRARAAALKDVFGTDNSDEIKVRLQRADDLEKKAEADKRAQMSEIERMKYDLMQSRLRESRVKKQLEEMETTRIVSEQQVMVERIASRHINPLYTEEAASAFARELAKKEPEEIAKMGERDIAKWFQRYAERKPAMAASTGTRKPITRPAGAATPPPRPTNPVSDPNVGKKDIRPGRPNSMSRAEAREEAKKRGYTW